MNTQASMWLFDKLKSLIDNIPKPINKREGSLLHKLALLDGVFINFENIYNKYVSIQALKMDKKDLYKQVVDEFSQNAPAFM